MLISTCLDLAMSADITHKYVGSPTTMKTMMHMLSNDLDRGTREVYPDAMDSRVKSQMDVSTKHTDTIKDYRSWHQYVTIAGHEDVDDLDFHGCLS